MADAWRRGAELSGTFDPVHEQFLRTARTHPDAVALVWDGGSMDYRDLNRRSHEIALGLAAAGIGLGDLVGLMVDRGPGLIEALLGVLRSGAAYVGLDPMFPAPRLAAMVAAARPRLTITSPGRPEIDGAITTAAELRSAGRAHDTMPAPRVDLDQLMYVIYTSGTTGRPKGIEQTHGAIANLLGWQHAESGLHLDRTLQFSSIAFDVHLQEIFATFNVGGRLVLVDDATRRDPDRLLDLLAEHRVTAAFLSVSTLGGLVGPKRLKRLSNDLRDLVVAGEQLHVDDALRRCLAERPLLRVHNHYGVSESHVVTTHTIGGPLVDLGPVPIGTPIANVELRLVDIDGEETPAGEPGDLWISGPCLALGYRDDEPNTAAAFVDHDGRRWYRSGDLVRVLSNGLLSFVGRMDDQVKVGGHLVEVGDVEAALRACEGVNSAAVRAYAGPSGEVVLAAWATTRARTEVEDLRTQMAEQIPLFMVPSRIEILDSLPIGPTGKVDKERLVVDLSVRPALRTPFTPPRGQLEQAIAAAIGAVSGLETVGRDDRFFDLGLSSLQLVAVADRLTEVLARSVRPVDLVSGTCVAGVAEAFGGNDSRREIRRRRTAKGEPGGDQEEGIAIIGAAGRFPGCQDVNALWEGMLAGRDLLTDFPAGDLEPSPWVGTPTQETIKRLGIVAHAERFDTDLFGIAPGQATRTDPQHRVFLEICFAALEDAGVVPAAFPGRIGVFAGSEASSYFSALAAGIRTMADYLEVLTSTDKDFLSSRVAHVLGLEGPAITVQTACSTSLVAVHLARRSLLSREADAVLAGGVSIATPQRVGHRFEPGLIYSADGRTRPYDQSGGGTNMTNGAAVVVLKRLSDAQEDGDRVLGVIIGSAVNNDGARKVGYAAPSVNGQIDVMADALADARLVPADVDVIEGHGTATTLGDAVEIAALRDVYGGARTEPLLLGSAKGNVGHLNRAAGVTGLIKAARMVSERVVPPTTNHAKPTEALAGASILVPTEAVPLPTDRPVVAAVTSLGIGGTNAHVVVTSAPTIGDVPRTPEGSPVPIAISAATQEALDRRAASIARWMDANPTVPLADIAHQLAARSAHLPFRAGLVARHRPSFQDDLLRPQLRSFDGPAVDRAPVLVFPGAGPDCTGALDKIYQRFASARDIVDRARVASIAAGGPDLLAHLVAGVPVGQAARYSSATHPSIVAYGVAIAAVLQELGIRPVGVVGLSLGQYAAAVVANSLDLEDAIRIVVERARLFDEVAPEGAMLRVMHPGQPLDPLLGSGASVAIEFSEGVTAVVGSTSAVADVRRRLDNLGIDARPIDVDRPHHSPAMGAVAGQLGGAFAGVVQRPPTIPMADNVTGALCGSDSLPVDRWCQHVVEPVRFGQSLAALVGAGADLFLDLSPDQSLESLMAMAFVGGERVGVIGFGGSDAIDDSEHRLVRGAARAWALGASIDLGALVQGRPVSLPEYPFGGATFTAPSPPRVPPTSEPGQQAVLPRSEWIYAPTWEPTRWALPVEPGDTVRPQIVVAGSGPLAEALRRRCIELGIAPSEPGGATADEWLSIDLSSVDTQHGWVGPDSASAPGLVPFGAGLAVLTIDRLLAGAGAGAGSGGRHVIVTSGAFAVDEGERVDPAQAGLPVLARIAEQERPEIPVRLIDLDPGTAGGNADEVRELAVRMIDEIITGWSDRVVAFRGRRRIIPAFDSIARVEPSAQQVRTGAVLVTGGRGTIGRAVCRHLEDQGFEIVTLDRSPGSDNVDTEPRTRHVTGDVTNVKTVEEAIRRADQMGGLVGVVHLAAAVEAADNGHLELLSASSVERFERFATAKVRGCDILSRCTSQRSLRFRVLFSSVATELGGLGYGAYAFSNRMADAVAQNWSADGVPWHVIGWDVWQSDKGRSGPGTTLSTMATVDACAVLDAVVAGPAGRVIVSTTAWSDRMSTTADLGASAWGATALHAAPLGRGEGRDVADLVRQLWLEALGRTDIPEDRSFLDLGGNSIAAIRVVIRANELFGLQLAPSTMLGSTTVVDFAVVVEHAQPAVPDHDGCTTKSDNASLPSRTSLLQERWFDMAARGFGELEVCVELSGIVDAERLDVALGAVAIRHPVLVATYRRTEGELRAVPGSRTRLETVDLQRATAEDRPGEIRRTMDTLRDRPSCLDAVPPFRPTLIRLEPERAVLVIQTHHIVMDGWSASLLVEDLIRCYDGEYGDAPPSYTSFAERQRRYAAGPEIESDREHWRDVFAGAPPPVRLPPRPVHAGETSKRTAKVAFVLDDLWCRVRQRSAERGTTPFTFIVAAFALLLREVTGVDDLVIGTTGAGRRDAGEDGMIGVFVNPLPIRIVVSADDSVGELLARTQNVLAGFHEHQRYVLADLVREVPPFRGRDINDAFHAYVLLQNFPEPQIESDLLPRVIELDDDDPDPVLDAFTHKHAHLMRDIELILFDQGDELRSNLWFRLDRCSTDTATRWSTRFTEIMDYLSASEPANLRLPPADPSVR